jgi:heparanase 1
MSATSKRRLIRLTAGVAFASIAGAMGSPSHGIAQTVSLSPSTMPAVGSIDERYQSYNVEMLEVTGGKFWRPYSPGLEAALRQPAPASSGGDTPAGMNPGLYEYRPPIDLTNARLRKLAAALGPAYVRVSGTWANTTHFPATDQAPANPPAGFGSVLTHQQWQGVIDFSKTVDARIVTSFANGVGTRDAAGVWTSEQAKRFLDYTASHGGGIAAAEFMNEPNLAAMGGAPAGYDAAAYGRDFKTFHDFVKQAALDMQILGPGSVGEATGDWAVASGYGSAQMLKTRDLLAASQPARVDALSYHHYGAVSRRCTAQGHQTTPEAALTEDWLGRTDETLAFYRELRDEFEPGRPFWLTETADAACGGNPWANTFLDSFRYLDQLGRLARQDVRVVAHNTLVASDYGLLDDKTLEPKPNYWAALLWRRLMGSTVLDAGVPIQEGLHVYAHCLRGTPGGVALLAINNSRGAATRIALPAAAERYTLAAKALEDKRVELNGEELKLGSGDELPELRGAHAMPGTVELAPATITFFAIPSANNGACQ